MALYNERGLREDLPRDGVRDVDNMVRPADTGSYFSGVLLVIALAFLAWFAYGKMSPTIDSTTPSITAPVTAPATPNATPEKTTPARPNP